MTNIQVDKRYEENDLKDFKDEIYKIKGLEFKNRKHTTERKEHQLNNINLFWTLSLHEFLDRVSTSETSSLSWLESLVCGL